MNEFVCFFKSNRRKKIKIDKFTRRRKHVTMYSVALLPVASEEKQCRGRCTCLGQQIDEDACMRPPTREPNILEGLGLCMDVAGSPRRRCRSRRVLDLQLARAEDSIHGPVRHGRPGAPHHSHPSAMCWFKTLLKTAGKEEAFLSFYTHARLHLLNLIHGT